MIHTLLGNAVVTIDVVASARFAGWLFTRTLCFPFTAATAGNVLSVGDFLVFHDDVERRYGFASMTYK
jgi:hypothetical protein